jgi:acetolactate synthase-1/2/3 large subunit
VTVVNNNNAYGQEGGLWRDDPRLAHNWLFSPVSYSKAAEAFGCKAYLVEKHEELPSALASALREKGPVVVEVMTEVNAICPPAWKPS